MPRGAACGPRDESGRCAAALSSTTPALAGSGYWQGFKKFWSDYLSQTDGVVLTVLVIGAVSLIIITRGKWAK